MSVVPRLSLFVMVSSACWACGTTANSPSSDAQDADTSTDTGGSDAADANVVPPALPATLTDALVAATKAVLGDDPTHGLTLTIDVPWRGRWTTGIGLADADQNIPMQGSDHLRVGSITKTFVTAAVLRDVEAGKLGLDDSAAALVPNIQIDPAITVRMLLSHRSGIFNYADDATFLAQAGQPITPEALYAAAAKHPPEFAPGKGYKYSNTNFYVLGMILEKLHGVALPVWLRQNLWNPLQLHDVWFEGYEDVGLTHVPGYLAGQPALAYDTSWAWAAGAVAANGSDLCTWLGALYGDGAVVNAVSLAAMISPSADSIAAGDPYGLGTMVETRAGRTVVGHTGSTMGFNAEVYFDRGSGICVAVLTNDFFGVRKQIGQKVWEVLVAGL